jgi:pre-mRNA branch site protein p14
VVHLHCVFFLQYSLRKALAHMASGKKNARLPPEVNRVLFVKQLPYDMTGEEMYDLFGKYGAIRQIRM